MKNTISTLAATALLASTTSVSAGEVEVLHWWTSGGEAASVNYLKDKLSDAGVTWTDFAVAGGGGENAMTVLKSRAISGNPPTAAQIKGPSIQEWGELGFLADIDDVAKANDWDNLLPAVVSDVMKHNGKYVAAPVNVHRVNWMWSNPEVYASAGATIPTTWDDFMVQAKKLQAADSQPPTMSGEGAALKADKKIDLKVLSTDEFDALPAETLRRMRGDFG